MSTGKVALALLAGMVAGAAAGFLFAPEAGNEMREKITDSLSDLGESIKGAVSVHIDNLVDNFKNKVVDVVKSKLGGLQEEGYPDDLEHA